MTRLGVGIIGLGMAIKPHMLALHDLASRVEVVAGYSPSAGRRTEFERAWGCRSTDSLDALLGDPSIAMVLVSTPPRTHGEIALRAAHAGKHVLVEKPLDVDHAAALKVVDEVEAQRRTFGVVFQHRFRLASMALREQLASHALGDLVSVSASIRWWRSFEYFAEPGRGMLARDAGGVLLTQAIHTLDLLLDLVGPVKRVTALVRTSPLRAIDTEDIACATVEYDNGAIGVVDATTTAYPGYPERIEIAGTRGSARLEVERLSVQRHGEPAIEIDGGSAGGGGADPMAFTHEAHLRLWEDFVAAVEQRRTPLCSARSGLRVQALIDAMLASSRTGRPVDAARTA